MSLASSTRSGASATPSAEPEPAGPPARRPRGPLRRLTSVNLSLQARLTLVAAAAVAVAIVGPGLILYHLVESALLEQIDDGLRSRAAEIHAQPSSTDSSRFSLTVPVPPPQLGGPEGYVQLLTEDGLSRPIGDGVVLPVTARDLQVAAGASPAYFRSDVSGGHRIRVFTTGLIGGYAIEIARPLDEVDSILEYMKVALVAVAVCGIPVAALLGRGVAHTALAPLHRLRAAVDHVTETQDMTQRLADGGRDELSRLASHFNRMLGALDQSLRTQRQLVADASHELRTPLASLRTNIEVLQRSPRMEPTDRERLLADLVSQTEQLTRLVQDLIDLARGDRPPEAVEEVRLDWIVEGAVRRAASHWPDVRFNADLRESVVAGEPGRLDRAVANLLDNAGKWSPPGQVVEVRVTDHQVTVRDHGPGIDPGDLPFVFDRFWRAPGARGMPGSGLGLAIVRQVAEAHGGSVSAELPEGGGTLMRLALPDS